MFTPDEEKQIILQWLYDLYKRLGSMKLEEIYVYLLGQSKEAFVQDLDNLLTEKDLEAEALEVSATVLQDNIKDLKKKIKKL